MTRKDYILLSSAIRRAVDDDKAGQDYSGIACAATAIANAIAREASVFDVKRFLTDALGASNEIGR